MNTNVAIVILRVEFGGQCRMFKVRKSWLHYTSGVCDAGA